jgi:hypothetical protein
MHRNPIILCGVMLVVFSLACQSVPFLAHPTPTPTTTPTPTMTPTPTGVPGITVPVTVKGVQLKVTRAFTANKYSFGGNDYTPKSTGDHFLVVSVDILTSGTAHSDVSGWKMMINNQYEWAFMKSTGDINSITAADWVFVLPISVSKFTLNFPDGTGIPLDTLL